MFYHAAKLHKSASEEVLTITDLQTAIDQFAAEHKVSPDIFFELLFTAATDYFIEEYASRHKSMDAAQAREYLFGEGKLRHSRPVQASFQGREWARGVGFYLKFQEQPHEAMNKANMDLCVQNRLWNEVIQAFFEHKLGQSFMDMRGMFITADWKGYAILVEMPIKALIRSFLPQAANILPKILADESKKQAYALPACKLNFDSMVAQVNTHAAAFNIETSCCDVFEFTLCQLLDVEPLPTEACFYPKCATTYIDFREHFEINLGLEAQAAISLVANANKLYPDAIKPTSNLNGVYKFQVKYRFIEEFILPKLGSLLEENQEFRAICQQQYADNTKDKSWAKFYKAHHALESDMKKLKM